MRRWGAVVLVGAGCWICVAGCGDDAGSGGAGATAVTGSGNTATATSATSSATGSTATGAGPFELTSTAFTEGGMIPQEHECEMDGGQNVSPPLTWTPGPPGTMSYAVVMRDLDFMNGFLHWVIWDIPSTTTSLPSNVEGVYQPAVPAGAKQAPFGGGTTGYFGPCSPNLTNTYEFTVYAIGVGTLPGLDQQSSKGSAEAAILGAALAEAALSGES